MQNGHVMGVASLNEGEWLCYRGSLFNGGGMVAKEVASLKEGEWQVTEVVSLIEGKWSCYRGGQFNGWSMVMLQRWPV